MRYGKRYAKVTVGLSISMLAATSGCSLWSKDSAPSKPDDSWSITKLWKKEYQKPQSLAAIWSPDVLTVAGQAPTRGFGARVFFYNEKAQAIPIDGKLVVHGYRNQPALGQSDQVPADKTFAFTAEQLTQHFSPSQLGASYSIWIPWDAAGGFREEVTLIPTFVGSDGSIVQGASTKLYLPGRSLDLSDKTPVTAQTVSYQQKVIPTNVDGELPRPERGMKVTTIAVPPSATLARPTPQFNTSFDLGGNQLQANGANTQQAVGVGGQSIQTQPATRHVDHTLPTRSNLQPVAPASAAPQSAANQSAVNQPATKPFTLKQFPTQQPAKPQPLEQLPTNSQPSMTLPSTTPPSMTQPSTTPPSTNVPALPNVAERLPSIKDLTPPDARFLPTMRSPIAFQPWTAAQPVQPASYEGK